MASQNVERKLTAILSADVKGYSRLMGDDEETTVHTLTDYRKMIFDLIGQHRGRVVDSPGDNILADFNSVVDAVLSAVEIQQELKKRNADLPEHRKMEFRIGINIGDVIVEGERIYGDGVNIAARLEALADPGGICISGGVYEQLKNKLALIYEHVGEQQVKNIVEPVQTYKIQVEGTVSTPRVSGKVPRRQWQLGALVSAVVFVLGAGAFAIWNYYLRPSGLPENTSPGVHHMTPAPVKLHEKPSIAVLPFVNMSDDPKQEHFVDGMTEDIITGLTIFEDLVVISRSSVFTYKGKAIKVNEVAQELGVHYVLEGSVRKSGDKMRITTQLVDATTGHHLWADRFDREMKDVFALQDEITQKVVQILGGYAVKPTKAGAERRSYEGVGIVIEVNLEKSRLVLKMQEIKGFMAPMTMNSQVKPATLLQGLKPGEKVRITIDSVTRTITAISQTAK